VEKALISLEETAHRETLERLLRDNPRLISKHTKRQGGKIGAGKLSGEALRKMLEKRSQEAQLSKPVTWHDFRRTFAGNLWDAKIDGVTIQKLMGHASQNQTAKYNRRPEAARRQSVKVLHVPYKKHQDGLQKG
jgi:integrase